MVRKTKVQMTQILAEIIDFVRDNEPCSGYRIYTNLHISETTARVHIREMVKAGVLDCKESRYRKMYSIPRRD